MTYGKAIDTIEHIEERSDEEIALAIYRILNMTTIMAVTKDNLLKIVRHLFDKCYEVVPDEIDNLVEEMTEVETNQRKEDEGK